MPAAESSKKNMGTSHHQSKVISGVNVRHATKAGAAGGSAGTQGGSSARSVRVPVSMAGTRPWEGAWTVAMETHCIAEDP